MAQWIERAANTQKIMGSDPTVRAYFCEILRRKRTYQILPALRLKFSPRSGGFLSSFGTAPDLSTSGLRKKGETKTL